MMVDQLLSAAAGAPDGRSALLDELVRRRREGPDRGGVTHGRGPGGELWRRREGRSAVPSSSIVRRSRGRAASSPPASWWGGSRC